MFSSGQLLFATLFVLVFIIVIILTYKKDKKLHRRNYKGVQWIGLFFVAFIIILFVIKYLLKK
ncbi:MAG TPA: hypothetical protein VKN36_18585 [Eudoraea sp.]|nr:hypothetical protein [Eudoraea sp.]